MMTKIKTLTFLCFLVSAAIYGQGNEVRIEIPGKADLVYDGERINIESTNTLLGQRVGDELVSGLENTFLGSFSGFKNERGSENTYIGSQAGYNSTGSRNVFIGFKAGAEETNNDKLYIANSETETPLIYGDFLGKFVRIDRNLFVTNDLHVDRSIIVDNSINVGGGGTFGAATISNFLPILTLRNSTTSKYLQIRYDSNQSRFSLENDEDEIIMEIKEGDVKFPAYAGTSEARVVVLSDGTLAKAAIDRTVFNRFDFTEKDVISGASNYTRLSMGVNLRNGSTITGIRAFLRDNDATGNGGVNDTNFVGLYRVHKISGNVSLPEVIVRIDGSDTPAGVHEEFFQGLSSSSSKRIVDNDNYIYLIQAWNCVQCSITQVEILRN